MCGFFYGVSDMQRFWVIYVFLADRPKKKIDFFSIGGCRFQLFLSNFLGLPFHCNYLAFSIYIDVSSTN